MKRITIAFFIIVSITAVVGLFIDPVRDVQHIHTIHAPAEEIFPHLSSLKAWQDWNTWYVDDPELQSTYDGPESGPGAISHWSSKSSGEGTLKITDARKNSRIDYEVTYGDQDPLPAFFELRPTSKGTAVTWSMRADFGSRPFGGITGLIMESPIQESLQRGLERLGKVVVQPQ